MVELILYHFFITLLCMSKKMMKTTVTITAIFSLISFAYKMTLGVLTLSVVLMIAAFSTFLVFVAKVAFVRNVTKTRAQKKKAYLVITVVTFIYSIIFILFSVLKAFNIDTSNQKTYEGLWGGLFILFIFVMFILSLIKLRGALEKDDLMVIGLKEITFVSALTDLVIIEGFAYRIVLEYRESPIMELVDRYTPLVVSLLVLIVPAIMLIRYFRYKANQA